jgi:hypothetical protein
MKRFTFRIPRDLRFGLIASAGVMAAAATSALAVGSLGSQGSQPPPDALAVRLDPLNSPDVYKELSADKRAEQDRLNQRRRSAATRAAAPPAPLDALTLAGTGPVSPAAPITSRIVDTGCDEVLRGALLGSNRWVEHTPDHSLLVCAGASSVDRGQGVVVISRWNADGTAPLSAAMQPNPSTYPSPTRSGSLTVAEALGEVLTLQAKDGTVFYFDAGALKYVDGPPGDKATPVPGAARP